ncbi:MAG: YgiQ family radical SAM protein [Bacteroidales bacterium]
MSKERDNAGFLPTSRKEMDALGWKQPDIILFSGDAYVDHPSFGTAVIGRMLESAGYKVAVVPQPNWQDDLRDFKKLDTPRLFFGVSAGNMDSMVNHYTAFKRLRHDDAYTPGNRHGARPDYPTIVYTRILKKLFPDVPVVIGGIEASMRRFTHYDYWNDKLMPGILHHSGADWLLYGMAEYPVVYLANAIDQNNPDDVHNIPNLQYISKTRPDFPDAEVLASHETCLKDKQAFASNFVDIEQNANELDNNPLMQSVDGSYLVTNPSMDRLSTKKMDKIYNLPFTRLPHPRYRNKPEIPAYTMIRHSINIHRGCFGACAFCTIAAHQGRFISSRSGKSIIKEVQNIKAMPGFTGHITDLGGPSANMYGMEPIDLEKCRKCKRPSCIYPAICDNLNTSHTKLVELYENVRQQPSVKKLSIGSGIRYDLVFKAPETHRQSANNYLEQVIRHHVSGRLKVAPEHTEDKVLKNMRKPSFDLYRKMDDFFNNINEKYKLKQQLLPYFISSHPGCNLGDMQKLKQKAGQMHIITEQSQDFTPTPMTLATVMYYTGIDPYSRKKISVARSVNEKKQQWSLLLHVQSERKHI